MSHWGNEYNLSTPNKTSITTVDEFCDKNSISFIDFLKVDVVGFEWLLFKGAKQTLDCEKMELFSLNWGYALSMESVFLKIFFIYYHLIIKYIVLLKIIYI